MARRIFIDCDDTLILYQNAEAENPFGYYTDTPYNVNEALVQRIRDWAEAHPEDSIFIWSGGGEWYAKMWMNKLRLGDIATPISKEPLLIREGDIVVDDVWMMRTHLPHEEWKVK